MYTMSVNKEEAMNNFQGSPNTASIDQRNEVAITRAVADISHHINEHWNINKVKCECCGLEEDCTQAYITTIRESYSGKWICGLCSDVMEEKSERAPGGTVDAAMISSHRAICQEFNSARVNPKLYLTRAMKNLAKRVSEKRVKSVPLLPFYRD